jgi:hypothetical protein
MTPTGTDRQAGRSSPSGTATRPAVVGDLVVQHGEGGARAPQSLLEFAADPAEEGDPVGVAVLGLQQSGDPAQVVDGETGSAHQVAAWSESMSDREEFPVYYPMDAAGLVRAAWGFDAPPSGPWRRDPTACGAPTPASGGPPAPGSTGRRLAAHPPSRGGRDRYARTGSCFRLQACA